MKACVKQLLEGKDDGAKSKTVSLYGTSASVPDRRIVADFTKLFLDACYATRPPGDIGPCAPKMPRKTSNQCDQSKK